MLFTELIKLHLRRFVLNLILFVFLYKYFKTDHKIARLLPTQITQQGEHGETIGLEIQAKLV